MMNPPEQTQYGGGPPQQNEGYQERGQYEGNPPPTNNPPSRAYPCIVETDKSAQEALRRYQQSRQIFQEDRIMTANNGTSSNNWVMLCYYIHKEPSRKCVHCITYVYYFDRRNTPMGAAVKETED